MIITDNPRVRELYRHAVSDVYQTRGDDLGWNIRFPDKDEFVSVLLDLMHNRHFNGLDDTLHAIWLSLPREERRRIILEVGP